MNQLDHTLEGVSDGRRLQPSLQRLLLNIAGQMRSIASNPEALASYADMLQRESNTCAVHVLANTPIIEATPPMHPAPEQRSDDSGETGEITRVGEPDDIDAFAKERPDLKESRRTVDEDGIVTAYFVPNDEAVTG